LSEGNKTRDDAVINLDHARVRLRSRAAEAVPTSLARNLEDICDLLDKGLTNQARSRLATLLTQARYQPVLLAQARCALSTALEMLGHYRDSLAAVSMYEAPEARAKLDPVLSTKLRVQIALAYNYNGDHPKAIALLNATLRELPEEGAEVGSVHAALARVYRRIAEYNIARDYSQRALESYRQSGDWRGLSEAYFGLGLADVHEGQYENSLKNLEQAAQLIGDHPASFLLGRIYINMAGACSFLKRPLDGIAYIEKGIAYLERTDHKASAADGYNNLAANLIPIGQWDRGQEALERALSLATEVDENYARVPMILDSLGELRMLRGDLEEAKSYLDRAVTLANKNGNKWYEGQALRTLGRCYLAMEQSADTMTMAKSALEIANKIGDRQAICESRLLLAEAFLECGETEECSANLQGLAELITDSPADLLLAGDAQRVSGLLEMTKSDADSAAQHFGRSVSIFDLLGDRYRAARAHYELGRAYGSGQPERAAEQLALAVNTFRELGARLDLEKAETATQALEHGVAPVKQATSALSQLLTLRLAEAVASRALLLRELAAVIHQETNARRLVILEPAEEERQHVVVAHGCDTKEAAGLADEFASLETDSERERFTKRRDTAIIMLRPSDALPATLLVSPKEKLQLPGGLALDPLLRVVELGMDVCALRSRSQSGQRAEEANSLSGSIMPGFIHSSPAMTRLVEEVHKIRSSDVTVLVTGESGTGKELVARAIHALSTRRDKVFVPFNCTAVPKELSEGYLFGYRRGAFTGAIKDSDGVIRAAAGGTLFLDEIGDLPIDVQPKLLRFLQEGEIQPLGEQRPMKVDVRIIAATNTDLEEMVTQSRFREDLYYRLNIIRLRVPPLRERRSEIPTIVNYYINHYSAKFGRRDIQMTPQAVDLLMVGDWPGNVRQLCNEVQRIVARTEDGTLITPELLSPELRLMKAVSAPATVTPIGTVGGASLTVPLQNTTLAEALSEVERKMIAEALRKHRGNISRAARELGLTRRGLYLKLDRYEMSASA